MFNAGRRGKRTKDGAGIISVGAHFNQQEFLIPTITGYSLAGDSDYEADDLALDAAGGQTITINGSGFKSGAQVRLDNSVIGSVSVTPTAISFTAPAKTAGTYTLYVTNPNGGTAVLTPGVLYSGDPTWVSPAAGAELGPYYETTSYLDSFVATNPQDAGSPIVYSLYDGAFPAGATLDSNAGTLSGTAPVDGGSTTYSFTIKATDSDLQDTLRSFTLTINTDVVTWSAPDTSQILFVNDAMIPLTLSAPSAAGYGVSYAADSLPTGLTLANDSISGTPTVIGSQYTTLTATAATTSRTATRTITWTIQLANDPYLEYTAALLQADNDTYLTDASSNQFVLTEYGDVKPISFSPYKGSYYSNYFDGSGDYLTVPAASVIDISTGDFTIEFWVYPLSKTNGVDAVFGYGNFRSMLYHNNSTWSWEVGSGSFNYFTLTATTTLYSWQHIALTRSGNAYTFWLNGVSANNTTSANGPATSSVPLYIGNNGNSQIFTGYISNFRFVKGTALYTAAFTPSTTPLTTTSQGATASEVSLLTCQSNRFIDNSTNSHTITRYGDTAVSGYSPFANTDNTTGSGYFDGTGDYLTIPSGSHFANFGTDDFTIEWWEFIRGWSGQYFAIMHYGALGATGNFLAKVGIRYEAYGSYIRLSIGGSSYDFTGLSTPLNVWRHCAIVRSGTTVKLYRDGIDEGNSKTISTDITEQNGESIIGGAYFGGGPGNLYSDNGNLSNLRVVKGTAVYTANFTPPTEPLTAIENTSLLTLQTNNPTNNKTFEDKSSLSALITTAGDAHQGSFTPYSPFGYSAYFDGNGDYLSLPNNNDFAFGTGNFTVEFWLYANSISSTHGLVAPTATGVYWSSLIYQGILYWQCLNGSTNLISYSYSGYYNKWTHVAFVRNGGTTKMYLDGVERASASDGFNYVLYAGDINIGRDQDNSALLNGYISNVRITKGTALYTSAFTPSTTALTPTDETVLLTCQSPSFIDNSKNRFALTSNGDVKVTPYTPFKGHTITPDTHSMYFDGDQDFARLTQSSSTPWSLGGSGDFTIECWFYLKAISAESILFDFRPASSNGQYPQLYITSNLASINYNISNSDAIYGTVSGGIQLNTWYHVALVRNSGTTRIYVDGTQRGSNYTDTNTYSNLTRCTLGISGFDDQYYDFNGYISNLRFVHDAVYTSSFTPPTSPLTAISNTVLLTAQSNTLKDNSGSGYTPTVLTSGSSQPTEFNPFGFTTTTGVEYDPDIYGGSAYFDGTGDYLQLNQTSVLTFNGSSTFTVEGWFYQTSSVSTSGYMNNVIGDLTPTAATALYWSIGMNSANKAGVRWYAGGVYTADGSTTLSLNTWYHIAWVVNSGSLKIFVNGTEETLTGTTTLSTPSNTVGYLIIGADRGYYVTGYMGDLRITQGLARYTSNFVPPKRVTSVASESLRLPFNDAVIYDSVAKANYNMIGNTKVSNAFKKYGSGSMYFDGNGDGLVDLPLVSTYYNNMTNPGSQYINTIEMWIYPTTLTSPRSQLIGSWYANVGWTYDIEPDGKIYIGNNTAGTTMSSMTGAAAITTNAWQHLAFVNDGTDIKIYKNGTLVATKTGGSICGTANTSLYIGVRSSITLPFQGYIDDLRITKGVARYTSTFTPPTRVFPKK